MWNMQSGQAGRDGLLNKLGPNGFAGDSRDHPGRRVDVYLMT